MKIHLTLVGLALGMTLAASQVLAGAHGMKPRKSTQDAVDYRTASMTIYRWYMKPMGMMAQGKIPFDAALFQEKAGGLATITRLDVSEGFPPGSAEDTEAKEAIWENWDDFKEKFTTLQQEAMKLKEVAASGDEAAIKKQFGATGKSCKGCHDEYRQEKKQ